MSATAATSTQVNYAQVGRLGSLGIQQPWQAALYLPTSYTDCREVDRPVQVSDTGRSIHRITVATQPQVTLRERRQPMLRCWTHDATGRRYKTTVYGDLDAWREHLYEGNTFLAEISVKPFLGEAFLNIHRVLPSHWEGKMVPSYPLTTSKIVDQDTLREKIKGWLPKAIPLAADHIRHQLQGIAPFPQILATLGAADWTIEALLEQAHNPASPEHAQGVLATLRRLAALAALYSASASRPGQTPNNFTLSSLEDRIRQLPYGLTGDQERAVREVAHLIQTGAKPIFHVVFGDVGSGKSSIPNLVAAAASTQGKRTLALYPTGILAQEQHRVFTQTFPDVATALVTAETDRSEDLTQAQVIFGTSALLHRKLPAPDILVCDEQHKWGRSQREKLAGPHTHVIEMSATCIPRSQALMRYGHITVSQLRQCPVEKRIVTRLWEGKEPATRLFRELKQDVTEGYRVLVVYPKRERGEASADRSNVSRAMEKWDAQFPGLVRTVTSDSTPDELRQALADFRSGAARLLVATTVVEIGVDIADLRRLIVIDPQRHGLSGLHQLRGRLARNGGEGQFHLVSNTRLPETSRKRVEALLATTDGFEIAEIDLRLRGPGDLRAESSRQSGADGNFLIGQPVELECYDEMNQALVELMAQDGRDHRQWGG